MPTRSHRRLFAGQSPSAIGYLLAREVFERTRAGSAGSVVAVVPEQQAAEELLSSLSFFLKQPPNGVFPTPVGLFGWEVLPFDGISPAPAVAASRIFALNRLRLGQPSIFVTIPSVLMQRLPRPERLFQHCLELRVGEIIDREEVLGILDRLGYQRATLVEELGQIGVRGAVLDIFPPGESQPLRLELFGNHLESIRAFDTETQRSVRTLESVSILPMRELSLPWDDDRPKEAETLRRDALNRIRDRASELNISRRRIGLVEEFLETGLLLPGAEHLQPLFDPSLVTLWEYCRDTPLVVLVNERAVVSELESHESLVEEQAARAIEEGRLISAPLAAWTSAEEAEAALFERASVSYEPLLIAPGGDGETPAEPEVRSVSSIRDLIRARRWADKPFLPIAEEIRKAATEGVRAALVIQHMSRAPRVEELLAQYDVPVLYPGPIFSEWASEARSAEPALKAPLTILQGYLPDGFAAPRDRVLLFAEADLFGDTTRHVSTTTGKSVRRFIASSLQLQENDFIVHVEHGIGVYRGLKTIEVDGRPGDFLQLEYAEGAKLFLPVENLAKIQKYSSADAKKPTLSKLGGKTWQASKGKIKAEVEDLAGQLVELFAEREIVNGARYGDVDDDDRTFADTFGFEETPDQRQAIADVLKDLDLGKPMDRLICGDVGYGKTEVAIRAAFKVANAGKQVAVLAPTTVLVDQHFATFQRRFEDTALRVAMVSRFQSAEENRDRLEKLRRGEIDIIIGTHRLLQRDVAFKDLGLVVIDEEHRFGVAHKEKLKRMRFAVHVLTLTATPIPRTLHMSMVGIRDLSVIETPPANRQIIRTHLTPYSDGVVREAIVRELGRSGQVFYIHNRVENIAAVAAHLAELVPEARVGFGHGQMKDTELEKVMHRFVKHELDVLVSTTIVESGLDIPNANTIIIRNADKFGLAELYQLRGRVGRSSRRAYAYLLVPDPATLTGDAQKRLQVLQSLDDLGIGFRLAIQDLEIRGAGNLLGRDQSGHIHAIGFELYSKILKEAIEEQRARRSKRTLPKKRRIPDVDPEMKVGFPAHIPVFYVPDVAERLLLYQRLIGITGEQQGLDMLEEIEDRFGNPPQEVVLLIHLMMFRAVLCEFGFTAATLRKNVLFLNFHPDMDISPEAVKRSIERSGKRLRLTPASAFVLTLEEAEIDSPRALIAPVRGLVKNLGISGE